MYRASISGLGAVFVPNACPPCTRLVGGTCVECSDGDTHPGCADCVDGEFTPRAPAWYENELLITIVTSTVVAVAVGMLVPRIERAIGSDSGGGA